MGVYVSVRGWLECGEGQLSAVQEVISAHEDGHYSNGWGAPRRHINWTHYLFYGADIREPDVGWLIEQIGQIARIPASDGDGDHVRGLFLASHEVDGMAEWQVRAGRLFISSGDSRLRYLDE